MKLFWFFTFRNYSGVSVSSTWPEMINFPLLIDLSWLFDSLIDWLIDLRRCYTVGETGRLRQRQLLVIRLELNMTYDWLRYLNLLFLLLLPASKPLFIAEVHGDSPHFSCSVASRVINMLNLINNLTLFCSVLPDGVGEVHTLPGFYRKSI